jgi:hypothetical protein
METIEKVHDYLDGLPATGKVLSLGTIVENRPAAQQGNEPLDSIEMAVLYTKLPDEYKALILSPYLSIADNEARFSVRSQGLIGRV